MSTPLYRPQFINGSWGVVNPKGEPICWASSGVRSKPVVFESQSDALLVAHNMNKTLVRTCSKCNNLTQTKNRNEFPRPDYP